MSRVEPMDPTAFTVFKREIAHWHNRNMHRLRRWHNDNIYKYRKWKSKMAEKCICGAKNAQMYL